MKSNRLRELFVIFKHHTLIQDVTNNGKTCGATGHNHSLCFCPDHPTLRFFLENKDICISNLLLPMSCIKPVVEVNGWTLNSWPRVKEERLPVGNAVCLSSLESWVLTECFSSMLPSTGIYSFQAFYSCLLEFLYSHKTGCIKGVNYT